MDSSRRVGTFDSDVVTTGMGYALDPADHVQTSEGESKTGASTYALPRRPIRIRRAALHRHRVPPTRVTTSRPRSNGPPRVP